MDLPRGRPRDLPRRPRIRRGVGEDGPRRGGHPATESRGVGGQPIAIAKRPIADPPSGALAEAAVLDEESVVVDDRGKVFDEAPLLLAYGRAAVAYDLEDARFLFDHPRLGFLRVRVARPADSPTVREVSVHAPGSLFELTNREIQVLTLIAGGLGNREIGEALGAKPKTVDTHVARLLEKLDQSSRGGAAAVAVDRGLVCLPLPSNSATSLLGLTVGLLHRAVSTKASTPALVTQRAEQFRRPVRRRPLLIGRILPTDANLDDTDDMRRGGDLAIAEINARGGIRGRLLEDVPVQADIWSHASMMAAVDELGEQGVDALVFGYSMDRSQIPSLLGRAASFGFPVLHSCTSSKALEVVLDNPSEAGSIFQLCGVDRLYGDRFVSFVSGLRDSGQWTPGGRRIAVLDGYTGMSVFSDEAANAAQDRGWDVSRLPPSVLEIGGPEIATELDTHAPDALLLSTFLDESLLLRVLEHVRGWVPRPLVYALYTPSLSGFIERAGPLADGLVWSSLIGRYHDRIGGAFSTSFKRAYGRTPGMSQAGIQYDAVGLLSRAWSQVSHPRDFAAVCGRLREGVHRGVDGVYWFGSPGQGVLSYPDETPDPSISQAHLIFQIQDAQHWVIAPSPFAEAPFRSPSSASGRMPPPRPE
ncbi:MAG: ABC transporter substrate-binding protein [Actinobacteria bacterium]|nr:ABC transporter substrate-binding protein [Actinomycetota bacterium]